jgi:hypothetical protein
MDETELFLSFQDFYPGVIAAVSASAVSLLGLLAVRTECRL